MTVDVELCLSVVFLPEVGCCSLNLKTESSERDSHAQCTDVFLRRDHSLVFSPCVSAFSANEPMNLQHGEIFPSEMETVLPLKQGAL